MKQTQNTTHTAPIGGGVNLIQLGGGDPEFQGASKEHPTLRKPFPPLARLSPKSFGWRPISSRLFCWNSLSMVMAARPFPTEPVMRDTTPAAPPASQGEFRDVPMESSSRKLLHPPKVPHLPTVWPRRLLMPITSPSANSSGPWTAPYREGDDPKRILRAKLSVPWASSTLLLSMVAVDGSGGS